MHPWEVIDTIVLLMEWKNGQNKEKNLAQEYGSFTKFPDLILMDGEKVRSILH